jgi:hypothetical protein
MSPPRSMLAASAYQLKNMTQPMPESEQKCSLRGGSGGADRVGSSEHGAQRAKWLAVFPGGAKMSANRPLSCPLSQV